MSFYPIEQGRKRPLDTPKRMIEREKEKRVEGKKRDIEREVVIRERDVRDMEKESERESHRALPYRVCALVENLWEISQAEI